MLIQVLRRNRLQIYQAPVVLSLDSSIGMYSEDIWVSLYREHGCLKYIQGVKCENGIFF